MGWIVTVMPRRLYPREWFGVHYIEGWVGLRDVRDGCGKSRPQAGCDHRTVQPVASCYTKYSIPVHPHVESLIKLQRRNQGLILSRICIVDEQTSSVRRETALFILISFVIVEAEPKTYPYWDCMKIATSLRRPAFGRYPIQLQSLLLMLILIIVQRDATQNSLFIIQQVHSTATSLQASLATLEGGSCTKNMTSTGGCSYSFVYSW